MVVKKRKLTTEAGSSDERPKYLPGKHPINQEKTSHVDYNAPINPKSELFLDDWHIPKFNRFISFTLDVLLDKYRDIFKDFIKLPSRKFHPQYYYKIQQPMSINEIKSRDYEYEDGPSNFLLDVELLTKNCQAYNEYDSLIVKNSMQVVMFIEFEVLKAKNLKRNYLINNEVKSKLLHYFNKLVDSTERKTNQALLGSSSSSKSLDDKIKLSEPFMELVDKEELPEYYEIIHNPMALSIVKQNLEIGHYSKIYDFIIDMLLVFQNAHIFNDPSALIYNDATTLSNYFNHLMQKEFFPELQDLSERGEINLEFDKFEFENYLAIGGGPAATSALAISALDNDIEPESIREDLIDQADYDFNHFEGLGNGYNRSLLTDDYLLNPNNFKRSISKPVTIAGAMPSEVKNEQLMTPEIEKTNPLESEQLKIPKYNIMKSIQREKQLLSEQHTMERKPYKLIQQIYIFSSKNLYSQATKPLPGSRPSCNQNWVEYIFNGNELSQNENAFSFILQPMQTFLTLQSHLSLSSKDSEIQLTINKEPVRSRNSNANNSSTQPQQQENNVTDNDTKQGIENLTNISSNNEVVDDDNDKQNNNNNIPEIFDVRLSEGLNHLVFKCEDKNSNETESMSFWINVLP